MKPNKRLVAKMDRPAVPACSLKRNRTHRTAGFKRPPTPIVSLAPSVTGKERAYKVILEKDAIYEKPYYLA